jgi:uncharacterized OB-fold protein
MNEHLTRAGEARVWRGTMPVQFRYTAGVAGERFFQTLRRTGEFSVTRCEDCRITYLPPRIYCERCFADLSDRWSPTSPTGRVHSYTVVHVDREGQPLKRPEVVAFVRFDGTDGGLAGRLLDVVLADVRLEMRVHAVLAPKRKRRGRLTDIVGFAPVRR